MTPHHLALDSFVSLLLFKQVLFSEEPAKNHTQPCPLFPLQNSNPLASDILRTVTHPGVPLRPGLRALVFVKLSPA